VDYSKIKEGYGVLKKGRVPPPSRSGGTASAHKEITRFLHRLGVARDKKQIEEHLGEIVDEIRRTFGDPPEDVHRTLAAFCSESDSPEWRAVCGNEPNCAQCELTSSCAHYNRKPSLKDLPRDERPRERLVAKGPQALSDAELLAILLRSGSASESAVELARRLLAKFGDFRRLGGMTAEELRKVKGIGLAKAAEIIAAMEIARRYASIDAKVGPQFHGSESVYRHFQPRLRDEKTEQFWLVMLDRKNRVIREEMISQGSLTNSLVHPREVFKAAISASAAAVVAVHNHPSGDPAPSLDDKSLTERLVETGELVGIRVLDHVIIGENAFFSFADKGILLKRAGP
jgi:DNA repair protein RadC